MGQALTGALFCPLFFLLLSIPHCLRAFFINALGRHCNVLFFPAVALKKKPEL